MSNRLPEVGEHLITTDGRVVVAVPNDSRGCGQCVFLVTTNLNDKSCDIGKHLPGIGCWSIKTGANVEFRGVEDE